MLTIKLMGGYGNQLFQYAFGLELRHRGYEVQYDKSSLVEGTHREYSLGGFGELPFGQGSGEIITEKSLAFNSAYLSPSKDCTMVGYWQSEEYFPNVGSALRDSFWQVTSQITPALFDWSDRICAEPNSVAIHVRRKDYVNLMHFHGMPEIDYYRRALRLFPDAKVFVFSDDPEWCSQNFLYATVVKGTNKYEDMKLMGACKSNIIANSSFSWWGAWMAEYEPRVVIAPSSWFASDVMQAEAGDIAPARWTRI